jgi:hypothetical protein
LLLVAESEPGASLRLSLISGGRLAPAAEESPPRFAEFSAGPPTALKWRDADHGKSADQES